MQHMTDSFPRSIANSEAAFAKAKNLMPGGVSSPVRAFKAVGGTPRFHQGGRAAARSPTSMATLHRLRRQLRADDRRPCERARRGGTFQSDRARDELRRSDRIRNAARDADHRRRVPSIEMVRFVNSGTEATMSAIRLARAATSRDLIVKCIG